VLFQNVYVNPIRVLFWWAFHIIPLILMHYMFRFHHFDMVVCLLRWHWIRLNLLICCFHAEKCVGPAEIWTRIAGFRVQSANHW